MSVDAARPAPARRDPRADTARRQAWLAAAAAVLLLLVWQTVDFTYLRMRPPPYRYVLVPPGGVAHGEYGDFRLLSWAQTPYWGKDFDDQPQSADPGAVWVVAQLEVTPRRHEDYFSCSFTLVGTGGRTWGESGVSVEAEGESCVPDPEHVELGRTYRFRQGYQVPEAAVGDLVGLSQPRFTLSRNPLLLPPS